jgi:hypothetical protein
VEKRLWSKVEARRWPELKIATEITVRLKHHPYNVSVVFIPTDEGALEPFAIQAFRNDGVQLSPREVGRLPLGRITAVAKAFAVSPGVERAVKTGRGKAKIDVTRLDGAAPRPRSSFSDPQDKYAAFAKVYRHYRAHPEKWPTGAATVAEAVALRLGKTRGTVDWMKHQARTRYGIDV